VAVLVGQWRCL